MKVEVDSSGLGKLAAKLEKLATGAQERLQRPAKQGADRIVATAKGNVYQNGLHYVDGSIRDSLRAYTASDGESVTVGVETDLDIAVFHELGTGPVGTEAGYAGEEYLDRPVARRSDGWTYYSEHAAARDLPDTIQFGKNKGKARKGHKDIEEPGEDRSFSSYDAYIEWKNSGFVYTEGVPPKAFMHNALMQNKDAVTKLLQKAAMEEMGK